MNIGDFTGLEGLTAVEEICIDGGDFVSIDLSKNTELKKLKITNSELKSIDLGNNMLLTYADLSNNKLEQLKMKEGNILETLFVNDNNLTFLDISSNYDIRLLHTQGNNISCIVVKPLHFNRFQSWERDENTFYSLYCESNPNNPSKENYTYIPDNNFEEYLISKGYDDEVDSFVLTKNISDVQSILIGQSGDSEIHSLKGIEDFSELTYLGINDGYFMNLDLSNNAKLQTVIIQGRNLESINLEQNKELKLLVIKSDLRSINLSKNVKLEELDLRGNKLKEVDLSNNPEIWFLVLAENNIESLNITAQTYLHSLRVSRNGMSHIYFSNVQRIKELDVSTNNLKELDLSSITSEIDLLFANENELSCIKVNQNQLSNGWFSGSTNLDEGVTFSTNCNY